MKSKKLRIESVSEDEDAKQTWIVIDHGHQYKTIYSIPNDLLNVIPEEGEELEQRWDDRRDNIELYYKDTKLIK